MEGGAGPELSVYVRKPGGGPADRRDERDNGYT